MKRVFFEGRNRFVFIPIIAVAAISLVSLVIMQLWNHLIPDIFHLGMITFWQALGLFILCKILFGFGKGGGRFGGGDRGPWMRRGIEEKLKHMNPEQKARFKAQMKERMCGPRGRRWEQFWEEDEGTNETETPKA